MLHSRYNPQAEADRYIHSLNLHSGIQYFILLEPGLGYLIHALKAVHSGTIVALHADAAFRSMAKEHGDIPAWYPDSPERIQEFLGREIPDTPSAAIRIIEWRPSLLQYGAQYLNILSEAADFIKRADANYRTSAGFGRRWIRNFFKNLRLLSEVIVFNQSDNALIITGSGPALEEALPAIRSMESQALVIAASSSVPVLNQAGICPDLVISTDGGSWALSHLYESVRRPLRIQGLALNLCAALPSQCRQYPLLALNDGSLWQTLILSELGIPSIITGQRGTVTASAIECGLELSRGPLYLAGVDLSVRDIQTHARPYTFDTMMHITATRAEPAYSRCFKRAYSTLEGRSLEIYAAWFKDRLHSWPRRIFALDAHNTVFAAAGTAVAQSTGRSKTNGFKTIHAAGDCTQYSMRAAHTVSTALNDSPYSAALQAELAGLLFPGKKNAGIQEIAGELEQIARQYSGAYE